MAAILSLLVLGCDTSLDPETNEVISPEEQLLSQDWQYQYVLMDGDTIREFWRGGEPTLDPERDTDIKRSFLRYTSDHSYELLTNAGFDNMGAAENYQPNFGHWDLNNNSGQLTLIHNKMIHYEKQYEILELTESIMRRRLIGPRTTYLIIEESTLDFEVLEVSEWIEVFQVME